MGCRLLYRFDTLHPVLFFLKDRHLNHPCGDVPPLPDQGKILWLENLQLQVTSMYPGKFRRSNIGTLKMDAVLDIYHIHGTDMRNFAPPVSCGVDGPSFAYSPSSVLSSHP
jgi:hypothetical protein